MSPGLLAQVLRDLPLPDDPRLLVGLSDPDDACVVALDEGRALVFTTDFFPPILDDPRAFGRVAAANALSDVYAMGGEPLMALNLVSFPSKELPLEVLRDILAGAQEACAEAGCLLQGGHSIEDAGVKFGLAVVGLAARDELTTAGALRPGDGLYVTKPLGSGILTTAVRKDRASPEETARVTEVMATLNREAAALVRELGLRAVTDVTGFGFLGHLHEMTVASEVSAEIWADELPAIEGALEHLREGVRTGGAGRTREHLEPDLDLAPDVAPEALDLALDPQTSGGLLVGCPEEQEGALRARLRERGMPSSPVGRVHEGGPPRLRVRPRPG